MQPGSGPRTVNQLSSGHSTAAAAGTRSQPPRNGWSAPPQGSTAPSTTPATAASTSPPPTDRASTCSPPTSHPGVFTPGVQVRVRVRLADGSTTTADVTIVAPPSLSTDHPGTSRPRANAHRDRHRKQLPDRRQRRLRHRHERDPDNRRLPDQPHRHGRDRRQRDARPTQRHHQQPRRESATLTGGFTVAAAPATPPSLSLSYEGKLRDRVGKGNGLTNPDGALDATFKVTVQAGSGARTVNQLELWTSTGAAAGTRSRPPRSGWSAPPRARQHPPQRQQRQRQLRHHRRTELLPVRPRPLTQRLHPRRPSPRPRPPRRRLHHHRRRHGRRTTLAQHDHPGTRPPGKRSP